MVPYICTFLVSNQLLVFVFYQWLYEWQILYLPFLQFSTFSFDSFLPVVMETLILHFCLDPKLLLCLQSVFFCKKHFNFFLIKCGISLKVDVKWKCYFLMSAFQNTYRSLFVTLRGCTLNQFIFRFVCRSSLHGHQHCSIVSSVSYNFVGEYKSEIVFFFYCAHHSSPSSKYSSKPRLQQRSGHEGKHTSDSVQLLGQTIRTTTTAVGWVKVQNQRFYFFFALTYLPHLMSEL